MQVKTLRTQHHWSQRQLALMSGLSVRNIQRIEKGESIGLETLKSLAAVFEVNVNVLKKESPMTPELSLSETSLPETNDSESSLSAEKSQSDISTQQQTALKKSKSIKTLYLLMLYVNVTYLLFILPNYNGGENLGPIVVIGISFAAMIGFYAYSIFKPFDKE